MALEALTQIQSIGISSNISLSGITTISNLNASTVNVSGVNTVGSLSIGATSVISSSRQLQNIASLDATTTATIESAIINAPNTFTDLTISGISTFTNGPVLIGSGTSTGTASQPLQVTGGGYISGNLGIGTARPQYKLDVLGDINFTGTFYQNSSAFVASRWTAGSGNDIYRLNGNVGIGTTNPQSKLDVNGTISATDTITLTTKPFFRNVPTIAADYTVTTSYNEMSIGPITINTGITVTVNTDATWTVI
jgi:hypothetical protein